MGRARGSHNPWQLQKGPRHVHTGGVMGGGVRMGLAGQIPWGKASGEGQAGVHNPKVYTEQAEGKSNLGEGVQGQEGQVGNGEKVNRWGWGQ